MLQAGHFLVRADADQAREFYWPFASSTDLIATAANYQWCAEIATTAMLAILKPIGINLLTKQTDLILESS